MKTIDLSNRVTVALAHFFVFYNDVFYKEARVTLTPELPIVPCERSARATRLPGTTFCSECRLLCFVSAHIKLSWVVG